jgi:hypothetical protein
MIRTQVYLPKSLYQLIQLKAEQAKKPAAQLVRELLEEGLRRQQRETAGEALLRLAKIGGKGPADLSSRIDDYLYGDAE